MIINGIITNGLGVGHLTIPLQLPHLAKYEPAFLKCHPASINVLLENPLKILKWDITTKPIAWLPNKPEIEEVFSFLKITFTYQEQSFPAWIYYPHGSPNRFDPFHVEVFTNKVSFTDNKNCFITIGQPLRQVSWLLLE